MDNTNTENCLNEGNYWFQKGEYSKALECYDKWLETGRVYEIDKVTAETILANTEKALQENQNNEKAWLFKGIALDKLGNYQESIACQDKAIELKYNYAKAYNYKGNALLGLGKYQEAITCYYKAIELNPDYVGAYNNKGLALYYLGKYNEAIVCYDKATELKPDYANAYNNKGLALYYLCKYKESIVCYDKATELKPDYANAYNNKGNALGNLGKYNEAIECYDKAIAINPDYANAYNNKGLALIYLVRYSEAAKCFKKAKINILDVFIISEETAKCMLADDNFFQEIIKDDKVNETHYDGIYITSLKILKELRVKNDKREENVAHYTSKNVAQILFFDNKKDKDGKEIKVEPIPFRLNSVTNSNDTQEGKTLFNYLFDGQKTRPQPERFVAFVGCFMFNHDNLNQFRLYGKDDDKMEGTGISIVMNSKFFCLEDKSPLKTANNSVSIDNKEPLFRCIYIDPETNQVVSVGHRDYHTFYYNGMGGEIDNYKKKIDGVTKDVTKLLQELKVAIKNKKLNREVICNLLLNLRYLVKHVAFKEEQECRIVEVKTPFKDDKNPPIDEEHKRFYVDYLPLRNCVNKLYFGPKATGIELFQNLLTYQEGFEEVVCLRSTSPLA
jgi:FOG: TPR repeat